MPERGIGIDDSTNGGGSFRENDFQRPAPTECDNAEAEGARHPTRGADDGKEPGFGFVEAIMMTACHDGKLVRHTELGGDHVDVANVSINLSVMLQPLGRLDEALTMCSSALEIFNTP